MSRRAQGWFSIGFAIDIFAVASCAGLHAWVQLVWNVLMTAVLVTCWALQQRRCAR